ncbi:cell division protein FtsQ/DivIB [Algihabitans albus]|uniref:cell division protein FtsQ/DivIB n=1 Tax=Algihabitans albus TaxID=2164067 RepID=UPI000E5CA378|nr:cell division protein FtsQ/DivIB [Algihabitans albus]
MRLNRNAKPARSSQPKRSRRTAKPARRHWRWALPLLGLTVLGSAGGWAASSGWIDRQSLAATEAFFSTTATLGLAVDDVLVEGRNRTMSAEVLAALDVGRGSPTLRFDPTEARDRLMALSWIADARVERRLPNLIFVRLQERQPLALWQLHGRLNVIDTDGAIIEGAEPARFAALPLLVGEGAPERAGNLLALLDRAPDLAELVIAAVRVGERRWNVVLEGDIEVRLPEVGAVEAWEQLAELVRDEALLERDVVTIDLRLPDRLILRGHNAPEPAWRRAADGEET